MAERAGRGDGRLSRRRFLHDALAAAAALIAVGCSPSRSKSHASTSTTPGTREHGQFGAGIDMGAVDDLRASIARTRAPQYVPEARAYVSVFPAELAGRARDIYPAAVLPALAAGVVVVNQKCPHLGCRIPWCQSSQWFECPCHSAKFDRVGEYRSGPAPRGMSLQQASIERGRLLVDTNTSYPGVPLGTNTTHQKPAGPFCV